MRRSLALFAASALALTAVPALAETFADTDEPLLLTLSEDVYTLGETIMIDAPVRGDLIAAGETVLVQAGIGGDIHAAGGTIDIDANVADDIRIAGGTIRITGTVGGDIIVFGGEVTLVEGATVRGNVIVFGGKTLIKGTVGRDLRVHGGELTLTGRVNGAADLRAGKLVLGGTVAGPATLAAERITFTEGARFSKDVLYWTKDGEMDFSPYLSRGTKATFDQQLQRTMEREGMKAGAAAGILAMLFGAFSLLSGSLVMLVLVLLTNRYFPETARRLKANPWMSLFTGFLFLVVTPVAGLILLVSIIGIPLALVLFLMYGMTLLLLSPMTALTYAMLVQHSRRKPFGKVLLFFLAVLFLTALKFLWFIPVLGWIVRWLLMLGALGALLHTKWSKWKQVA